VNHLKPYPTPSSQLGLPIGDRRSALAGIALYAPSRRRSTLLRDLSRLAVIAFGPRVLPGRPSVWVSPMPAEIWSEIMASIAREIGRWDSTAVYGRSGGRSGFTLAAISKGTARAMVRVERRTAGGVCVEAAALRSLAAARTSTFVAPRSIATGSVGEWAYGITEAMDMGAHRMPKQPDLDSICDEISGSLDLGDRPPQVPTGWMPIHGDLTPWNLRQRRIGPPVLLDWESVTWGPPGADKVLYRASAAAVGRGSRPDGSAINPEAIDFWWSNVEVRMKEPMAAGAEPDVLNEEILRVLEVMARGIKG
jgi:hypothetical protein